MRKMLPVLILLIVSTLQSQTNWVWQSPLPQGNHLNDIWVLDQNSAIGIGDEGTFIRTTDGGQNWDLQVQLNQSQNNLTSIYFLDDSTGWIVGEIGTLFKTIDQGVHWFSQDIETPHDLYDIVFTDSANGWAVGRWGTIFHTFDGGESWIEQNSNTYRNLRSVFFMDKNMGWAVGHGGTILKTIDSGNSWQEQTSPTLSNLWSVYFVNPDTGWACGQDSTLLKTINGGQDWSQLESDTRCDFSSIAFMNPDTGLVVGFTGYLDDFGILQKLNGIILKTTDGGQNWLQADSALLPALNAVNLSEDGMGWAVGETGTLLASENLDSTWQRLSKGTSALLTSVFFIDPDTGWTLGSGQLLKTTDGGENWNVNPNPPLDEPNASQYSFRSLQFLDADTGYVAASYIFQTGQSIEMIGTILKTIDGGYSWSVLRNEQYEYNLDLQMLDADTGYVINGYVDFNVGAFKPQCMKTVNGGRDWTTTDGRLPNTIFYSLDFIDSKTGWLAGETGSIYKTTDGGQTWTAYRTGLSNIYFEVVDFYDDQNGWAIGSGGTIIYSNDGGETWQRQETYSNAYLVSLAIIDRKTVWVAGTEGTILNTLDGGTTWSASETHTQNTFYSIYFPTISTGWVVGENGNILKTTDGTTRVTPPELNFVSSPSGYRLDQNYPNPFNPETAIRFSIPRTDHVTLKVYDLLGREIATLFDGLHEAGTYQILFHADNLSSGIYFYRLEATDFVQTRKFIIQK